MSYINYLPPQIIKYYYTQNFIFYDLLQLVYGHVNKGIDYFINSLKQVVPYLRINIQIISKTFISVAVTNTLTRST